MTPTVPGTKCSCEGGLGVGEETFVVRLGSFKVCLFFFPHNGKASRHKPKQALRVLPPLRPALPASLRGGHARCQSEGKPAATRGPGWGDPATPGPRFPKGRELKGGEDRERGRDAEGRHQFSIPQWLQKIFTLVSFPLPSWKGEAGTSTSRENFPGACVEGYSLLLFPPV